MTHYCPFFNSTVDGNTLAIKAVLSKEIAIMVPLTAVSNFAAMLVGAPRNSDCRN